MFLLLARHQAEHGRPQDGTGDEVEGKTGLSLAQAPRRELTLRCPEPAEVDHRQADRAPGRDHLKRLAVTSQKSRPQRLVTPNETGERRRQGRHHQVAAKTQGNR
jgi:hypothetical protein